MMLKVAKLGIALVAVLAWIAPAADAGVPDPSNSYYVPEAGANVLSPLTGTNATRWFKICPNNDGGLSAINHPRIKVFIRDSNNQPIPNVAAADICILFNGGTQAQGFEGLGADSVIANSTKNPTCPDVRCVAADAASNASGVAYITFAGGDPNNPGTTMINPNRKWGHFDSKLPVFVLGYEIFGRLNPPYTTPNDYTLRIKNFDWAGGTTSTGAGGMIINFADFSGVASAYKNPNPLDPFLWWKDFDGGGVGLSDFTAIVTHYLDSCTHAYPDP